MLTSNDQYPGFDVESGCIFMSDVVDAYGELAKHCSTFGPELEEANALREQLRMSNAAADILAACDRIIRTLDVHDACPVLARADH